MVCKFTCVFYPSLALPRHLINGDYRNVKQEISLVLPNKRGTGDEANGEFVCKVDWGDFGRRGNLGH